MTDSAATEDDFDYCDGSAVCLARLHLDFCRSLMGFNELAEQEGADCG